MTLVYIILSIIVVGMAVAAFVALVCFRQLRPGRKTRAVSG
jgi:hypothetical protein